MTTFVVVPAETIALVDLLVMPLPTLATHVTE